MYINLECLYCKVSVSPIGNYCASVLESLDLERPHEYTVTDEAGFKLARGRRRRCSITVWFSSRFCGTQDVNSWITFPGKMLPDVDEVFRHDAAELPSATHSDVLSTEISLC